MLREWRTRRRYSQLALALEAGTSARHLSFLETGRSSPSREMVHRLSEHLEIPIRERNTLLLAAGFAPARRNAREAEAAERAVQTAVDLVLGGFEPFPAIAVDRHWTLLAANRAMEPLLSGVAPHLIQPPVNVLRASLHPDGVAPLIVNLQEWRVHVLHRLEREATQTSDPDLTDLLTELSAYPDPSGGRPQGPWDEGHPDLMLAVPLRISIDGQVLSFISTTTVFGTAVDVALAEVTIESFLPEDEATRTALQAMAADR
jgi:transcriptional regulator with XRE-family HTH domain